MYRNFERTLNELVMLSKVSMYTSTNFRLDFKQRSHWASRQVQVEIDLIYSPSSMLTDFANEFIHFEPSICILYTKNEY